MIKGCTVLCYDKFELAWFMYSHALWRGWVDLVMKRTVALSYTVRVRRERSDPQRDGKLISYVDFAKVTS